MVGMMIPGIKVGSKNWQPVLEKTKPDCCEVWFRLDWEEKYTSLFKYLNKNKIPFGLHFWATVEGKYYPNLLHLNKNIADKTYQLILKTIDLAAKYQAKYVVFHPESYRLSLLDLDKKTFKVLEPDGAINREKSWQQLLFYLEKIKKYAKKKKVTPLIETVPKYNPANFENLAEGRLHPEFSEGLETEKFFRLAKLGFPLCFDIEHTMSQLITNDKDKLFNYAFLAAQQLKPSIGLIHVTTKVPPFNGTDSHNGVLPQDFAQGVVPDKEQLIKFLSLFKTKDIWLIPEPHEKMVENYFALKEIVRRIKN